MSIEVKVGQVWSNYSTSWKISHIEYSGGMGHGVIYGYKISGNDKTQIVFTQRNVDGSGLHLGSWKLETCVEDCCNGHRSNF